jgi:single-strand DNA-binding protein
MASLNKVFMIGNLTRDPELRYIPSGTAVASFTLASNRVYSSAAGEKKEEACFVRVVAWARQAELCGEYLTKGSPVFVEGRLQSRSWETPDGQKRSTLELVAQNIQFLGRGSKGAGDSARAMKTADAGILPDEPPAGSETIELPPEGEDRSSGEVPF